MAFIVKMSIEPRFMPLVSWRIGGPEFFKKYPGWPGSPLLYDENDVPKEAILQSPHKYLCDFVPIHGRMSVSARTKELIDDFEPGVHQFFPIYIKRTRSTKPIFNIDGSILSSPYYFFSEQTILDPVYIEKSEVRVTKISERISSVYQLKSGSNVVLRKSVIDGFHIWRGGMQMCTSLFFSDALAKEVVARKLRQLDMQHCEEV